jgi:hypothetical protein
MKSKEEILKMTRQELLNYKQPLEVEKDTCSGCSDCSSCSGCSDCSRCSDCFGCQNIITKSQYLIANVQFTKEEYETKMKEIREKK